MSNSNDRRNFGLYEHSISSGWTYHSGMAISTESVLLPKCCSGHDLSECNAGLRDYLLHFSWIMAFVYSIYV